MNRSQASGLLCEMEDAWKYVSFARMMFGFALRKGRYNTDRRLCAPKVRITVECAEDWGLSPHLAAMLVGRKLI